MTTKDESPSLRTRIERALDDLEGIGAERGREAVRELSVSDAGRVEVTLDQEPGDRVDLAGAIREALSGVEGVSTVEVAVRPVEGPEPGPRTGSGRELPVMGGGSGSAARSPDAGGGGGRGEGPRPTPVDREASSRHPKDAPGLPGVSHVIAVSSGKGGVGKSTVATNLAAAWADRGHRVGLLDADVYGPDIPTMFGVYERPRMEDGEVVPLEAHGVKLMSIGFLVDEDTPAIWRGPIIQGIVRQFLQQVRWGELDYLVVDLPPGTGDAQLSLVQLVRVTGGVFVTTPQDVAVGGVLKGVKMFERLEIPVLGIVENMRGFVCPGCGERHEIFGSGGGEKLAASLDLPFLGSIPLGTAVREEGDRGLPTVLGRPDSPEADALGKIADATVERARLTDEERESDGEDVGDEPAEATAAEGDAGDPVEG
jgi:ATP-binding protein involved in chromosome partitioning